MSTIPNIAALGVAVAEKGVPTVVIWSHVSNLDDFGCCQMGILR